MECMYDVGITSLTNRYLTWKIYNFYSLPLIVGTELRCPKFDSRYTLVIWPRGRKGSGSEEWFEISLYKNDASGSSSPVQFSIVNPLGAIKTCTVECSANNIFRQERFIKWSELRELSQTIAPDGCFTIVCNLPKQDSEERYTRNGNMTAVFRQPMAHPPVKYQSGDYHLPISADILYKLGPPETQNSPTSGFNYENPSTINSFFSTSTGTSFEHKVEVLDIENSESNVNSPGSVNTFWRNFTSLSSSASNNHQNDAKPDIAEDISANLTSESISGSATSLKTLNSPEDSGVILSESTATSSKNIIEETKLQKGEESHPFPQNSDLNMSHSVSRVTDNTFWKNFTRGFFRASRKDQSDPLPNPVKDISENLTSGSIPDSTTPSITCHSPENNLNSSATSSLSDSVTTSSQTVVEETEPLKAAQSHSIPNSSSSMHSFEDLKASSASHECMKVASSSYEEHLSSPIPYPKGLRVLSQDLKKLYLEGKIFDLKIIMENKEFKVVKFLLMARSPFFKKLLSENTSSIIIIDRFDACDSSVFHDFLIYVYSGEIENFHRKNIYGLYSAAHKFELPDLKEECIKYLRNSLSIDTVTDTFRLLKNERELLDMAISFLARNMEVIMDTDEWKQFMREETSRAIEFQLRALKVGYKKTIT